MAGFSRIALIGFGEVGQTLGRRSPRAKAGCLVVAYPRFDILFGNARAVVPSLARTGEPDSRCGAPGESPRSAADAGRDAELIVISAVTAAVRYRGGALASRPVCRAGTFYLDVNSVSPRT